MTASRDEDIARRFTPHPPVREGVAALEEYVRAECLGLANEFNRILPPYAETVKAIDAVDQACESALAAIGRWYNGDEMPVPEAGEASKTLEIAAALAAERRPGEQLRGVWLRMYAELKDCRQGGGGGGAR